MFNRTLVVCSGLIFLVSGCDIFSIDSSGESNLAPLAAFEVKKQSGPRSYFFDASNSTDPNGDKMDFSWDYGDGFKTSASSPHHTYEQYGTYRISLTVSDPYKASNTQVRELIIKNDHPIALFSVEQEFGLVDLDASNSSDSDDELTDESFSWDFGDGSDIQTGKKVSYMYERVGDYTITLTVTDDFGLETTLSKNVNVESMDGNNPPSAFFTRSMNGLSVALDASGSSDIDDDALTYLWNLGDGKSATSQTLTHTYDEYKEYIIELTVMDEGGLTDSYSLTTVLIDPNPVTQTNTDTNTQTDTGTDTQTVTNTNTNTDTQTNLAPVLGGVNVFVDGNVYQFDASSTVDDYDSNDQLTFVWDFGDNQTAMGEVVSHEYTQEAMVEVTLAVTDSSGLVSNGSFGLDVKLNTTTSTQTNTDTQTLTNTETDTQTQTETETETETVTTTDTNTDTNQAPVAAFNVTQNNRMVTLDASISSDADNNVLIYIWDMGDGQPSITTLNALYNYTYSAPGSYTITLNVHDAQPTNNQSSATMNINIANNIPSAEFSIIKNGLDVTFNSQSVDSDGDAVTLMWDFGDGQTDLSNASTLTHTFADSLSYDVSLTATDSFGDSSVITKSIDLSPTAENLAPFIVTELTQNGYKILVDASASSEPENEVMDFVWTLGDANEILDLQSIDYTYEQPGEYLLQLKVSDQSGNDSYWTKNITVALEDLTYEQLAQKMSVEVVTDLGCLSCHSTDASNTSGFTIESSSSEDIQSSIYAYLEQDFNGDINLKGKPNGEYLHTGGFIFEDLPELRDYWNKYIDDTKALWTAINRAPVAAFEFDNIINLLVAVNASTSYDENGDSLTYLWQYEEQTATGKTPVLSFSQAGVFDIELTVFDGELSDTIIKPVTVTQAGSSNTPPTVSYSINKNYLQVNFDASDSVDNDEDTLMYLWTINGETFNSNIVDYTFTQAGNYDFSIYVSDGVDSVTKTGVIEVIAPPIINQAPTAVIAATANGLTVLLDASGSSDPEDDDLQYTWTVNDETFTTETIEYTFDANGSYLILLVVTDSMDVIDFDTTVLNVSAVNQAPIANLVLSMSGANLVLNGSGSTDPEGGVLTYSYEVESQTYSGAIANHTISQIGTYQVELTVTDNLGLSDTITQSIEIDEINHAPVAAFEFSADGFDVHFDASSSSDEDDDSLEYTWQISGHDLIGVETDYTFGFQGAYLVKLTVTDEHGLESTLIRSVSVSQPDNYSPTASFVVNQNFMDVALDATMSSDVDGTIVSYTWTLNNVTREGATLDYSFTSEGTFTIVLEVTDNGGKTDTYSEDVTVTIDPNANKTPDAIILSGVQAGQYIYLNASNSYDADSTDTLNFTWFLSNGDVFYGKDFYYEAPSSDMFTATLTVSDSKDVSTASENVTVSNGTIDRPYDIEMFEMAAATTCASSCHTDSHPFTNRYDMTDWDSDFRGKLTTMGITSLYEFPSGQSGGHEGGNAIGTSNWEKWLNLVRLVDADMNPGSNQPVQVDFSLSVAGDTVTLTNNSTDPEEATLTYLWEFGDFETSTLENPTHIYSKAGQYVIKLTVSDGFTNKQLNKLVEIVL